VSVHSLSPAAAGLALAAGFVSFLSPCVLPLLPVYLSYVSGVSVERLQRERWAALRVTLAFVAGFTAVFVVLGAGAGGVGSELLHHRRVLTVVAGAFLILSGVMVMGLMHLPLHPLPGCRGCTGCRALSSPAPRCASPGRRAWAQSWAPF